MENIIIKKINNQISKIQELDSDDRHFKLDYLVESILSSIMELIKLTEDKEKEEELLFLWKELDYTLDKEVKFAKRAFDKARKKNSAKIREVEYSKSFKKAISQVKLELNRFKP